MSVPGTDLQGWRWLRGRAGMLEYWLWVVVILAWSYILAWADDQLPLQVLITAFWLQVVRRLHDLGRSGWWIAGFVVVEIELAALATYPAGPAWLAALPGLFTLAGFILIGAVPGERSENRFGPPPRRRNLPGAPRPIRP